VAVVVGACSHLSSGRMLGLDERPEPVSAVYRSAGWVWWSCGNRRRGGRRGQGGIYGWSGGDGATNARQVVVGGERGVKQDSTGAERTFFGSRRRRSGERAMWRAAVERGSRAGAVRRGAAAAVPKQLCGTAGSAARRERRVCSGHHRRRRGQQWLRAGRAAPRTEAETCGSIPARESTRRRRFAAPDVSLDQRVESGT